MNDSLDLDKVGVTLDTSNHKNHDSLLRSVSCIFKLLVQNTKDSSPDELDLNINDGIMPPCPNLIAPTLALVDPSQTTTRPS